VRDLATYTASRYLQPLREGGSLPAVVDTDGGLFVVKFRGTGHGAKALIAELVVGLLASDVGLPTPELALVEIAPSFGRGERDPEIQDIMRGSHGVNVGLRYLDGAFNFDRTAAGDLLPGGFAPRLVWFDGLMTNPDRTHRNPNLLIWKRSPWLIDHGSALYAHHDWAGTDESRTRSPFPRIREHVLLDQSEGLEAVDAPLAGALTEDRIAAVLDLIPDPLLLDQVRGVEFPTADAARARYRTYLTTRLLAPRNFVTEAIAARDRQRSERPRPLSARR